ncbi:hypothetical protein TNCT_322541 [Trichonephila clavata]|uniref:Uncharacterized protein n=1 Tax=Trichonephila clavata TaxID=2740835 RepID=A0A8X6GC76_TRICU|nr:hypothetical protein TNCT_322541 [Trichonephila clavata]
MQNFPRASEERSGSSDSRRASAEFVLRQPHGRITAAGWRTVRSADTRLFPCHGRIRKSVPDPPTPVVLRRSWCYNNPSVRSGQWFGKTFVPPRHDIHRAVEGFRTEFWTHRPCVQMHV